MRDKNNIDDCYVKPEIYYEQRDGVPDHVAQYAWMNSTMSFFGLTMV